MKKILYILLMMLHVARVAAATSTGSIDPIKKCKTCGKAVDECPYDSERPKGMTQADINRILKELESNRVMSRVVLSQWVMACS